MAAELGSNQRVVLLALATLDARHGPRSFFAREIVDEIWRELQAVSECPDVFRRAAAGDPDAAIALRVTSARDTRSSVRHRASRPPVSPRRWAQAVEVVHPHRSFLTLAERGLVARSSEGSQARVMLTDAGRQFAAAMPGADQISKADRQEVDR